MRLAGVESKKGAAEEGKAARKAPRRGAGEN
jgi:hypothetical protein